MKISIPVGAGELIDKITILTIKTALMAAFILDFNRMSGGKKCH